MFTFTNPLLLWAFPILILPWIFRRRQDERIQHIEFPLLQFLKESEEKDLINPKLQELLLLILRTILLAVLLLALAGPKWVSNTGIGGSWFSFLPFGQSIQSSIVVLDTSYSMGYGLGDDSWWKHARQAFDVVDHELSGFSTQWLSWDEHLSEATVQEHRALDKQALLDRFDSLPKAEGLPVDSLFERLQADFSGDERCILITDGQRIAWENLLEQLNDSVTVPPTLVVTIGQEPIANQWLALDPSISVPWGIAAWETLVGKVKQLGEETSNRTLTVVNEMSGETLYSEQISIPPSNGSITSVPFSITLNQNNRLFSQSDNGTGTDSRKLLLSLFLEGEDSLPLDDRVALDIPSIDELNVGLVYHTANPPDELEFMQTALNPIADSSDSAVHIQPISLPDVQYSDRYDMVVIAPSFAYWWKQEDTAKAMEYLRRGGTLAVFTGDKTVQNQFWEEFLSQLGWTWLSIEPQDHAYDFFTDSSTTFGTLLSAWDASMWRVWRPERFGRLEAEHTIPHVSMSVENQMAHIIASMRMGEGEAWVIDTAVVSSNEAMWSPIFPVMLWELEKHVARRKLPQSFQTPRSVKESDLRLLSQDDKQFLTENYNIQFADMDSIDEKLTELYGGLNLRYLLLLFCIFLALVESWLSNRLASL